MSPSYPITRDLVLLGGGHTHALVLRKWAMQPLPGVQISLVNPSVKAPYTGMLPGFVAGHYARGELDIDLVRLARQAGARLIVDRAIGIDTETKTVQLESRPAISYDTLSIDIGISSYLPPVHGDGLKILPAKPLGPFADAWTDLLQRAEAQNRVAKIAIIGAGVAGVELALAMAYRLRNLGQPTAAIRLVEAQDQAMRELNHSARRDLMAELEKAGIALALGAGPDQIERDTDFIVSTAGASPHAWLQDTSLALDDGYIAVDARLQSINTPDVFATGDCAHLTHAPRPKAGVFAVRQAPVLFANLRAALAGGTMQAYRPQRAYLKLISKGRQSAVTDKWGIGLSGNWVWRWKDRIDKAFMQPFQDRIEMAAQPLPPVIAHGVASLFEEQQKACGACGAKVAQSSLSEGLDAARTTASPLRLEDAVIKETENGYEVYSTDHLRAFGPDPYLLAKVAAIHALGDIWAMGAAPKSVLANIILPPLAPEKQSAMIAEIMSGANGIFEQCGTQISGGHTSNGAELTIGFSIIGEATHRPIEQNGAKPGDVLVLTKPIGTGLILAAEMQQRVDGDDYQAALVEMCRLQAEPARLLAESAHAMTDVTGFGLGGHLLNILDASEVGARLTMDHVPVLPGAASLHEAGLRASLYPENAKHRARFDGTDDPRLGLLFDPQTCGGLLACVPEQALSDLRAAFKAAAQPIWEIGTIVDGPTRIQIV